MARFFGKVGFSITVETDPGVWESKEEEYSYSGDVFKDNKQYRYSEGVNDNIELSNRISIVADRFMYNNTMSIKYVVWMNSKWKVTNAEVQRPRVILTLGGVYNET